MVPWTRTDQTRPDHLNRVSSSLSRSCSISIFSKYFSAEQTYCIGGQMCINRSRQLLGSGIFNSRKLVVFEFAEMCLYLINLCTFCIYSVCSSVWLIRRGNQDQVLRSDFQQWWFNLSQSQLTWLGCFVQKDIFPIYNSGGDESFISSESQRKCFCQIIINIYTFHQSLFWC